MPWFDLPIPQAQTNADFADAEGARAWLAGQSQAVPARSQQLLAEQLERLAAMPVAPFARATILEVLRKAAVTAHDAGRRKYAFQPRPLAGEADLLFVGSGRMWSAFAANYLRCIEEFANEPAPDALRVGTAAHRAMVTLRLLVEDHYLAGRTVPGVLWKTTHRLLQVTHTLKLGDTGYADPEFRDPSESTLNAQYAILALTTLCDPYRLAAPQFAVLQRALFRWRNLVVFAPEPGSDERQRWLPLALLPELPAAIDAASPQWMEISGVRAKLRRRIKALDDGETPEALQLGRDLSARACRDFLGLVINQLRKLRPESDGVTSGTVRLATGTDDCYALLAGRSLAPETPLSATSARVSHEQIAIFGQTASAAKSAPVLPGEAWTLLRETMEAEELRRPADGPGKSRLLPGQLVAVGGPDAPPHVATLGSITRVEVESDGALRIAIRRFAGQPQALEGRSASAAGPLSFPLFLLPAVAALQQEASIILPSGFAIRLRQAIRVDGRAEGIALGHLVERGNDFERYSFTTA